MIRLNSATYEIIGIIGQGNSGEIYKAYHKNLGKYVVLKKIRSEIQDFVDIRAEVDVLKNLKHSCLPQVYDFLRVDGSIYTVMDFIPGNSFKQYLDAGRVFGQRDVIIWMKQICATLGYLHRQKPPIIHSDLKPGNVMLLPNGTICLIDFNISFSMDGRGSCVTGYTSGYAAPEQIMAMKYNQNEPDSSKWKTIDARADLYSLGATVYHLLTGRKPVMMADGHVADIRSTGVEINDVFASIIMKCLEPDPGRRYQNAARLMQDLQNISRNDKRYKSLLLKQQIIYASVILSAFLFAGIAVWGFFQMDAEKQKKYEQLVRMEADCVSSGDYQAFESYYEKAVQLSPGKLDAYYQKALALNDQRQYEDCIEFINSEILSNRRFSARTKNLDQVYYLLGDSYEQMGYYADAAGCYEKAIESNPDNADYYRDYAIALAYNGQMEEAQRALENARSQNLNSVEIDYVEGEILFNSGDFAQAKETFLACIENAGDDYLKMRSYIMAGKCIDAGGKTVGNLEEKIGLLEQAKQKLGKENNIGILEELAQAYSDMGGGTGDTQYYTQAISVFEQIRSQGMGSYDTDYNLSVLYQSTGDYARASELLSQMLDKYGENYRTYKSLAFLEVARQADVVREQRSYADFQNYYHKALELYQDQYSGNNANDIEMDRLTELYDQAAANGWL